ncbi:MAG: sugar phosphate isomerase/epimerase family protein [Bryobacteraceae bacterium]
MSNFTRRSIFRSLAAASAAAGTRIARAAGSWLRVGVTDWNLYLGANPQSVRLAARLGFKGIQVSFGRQITDGRMPADHPEIIAQYLQLSEQYKVPIDGTCVDRLHINCLKSDPQARKWLLDSIRLTKALKTKVLLVPFFGHCALRTSAEMDRTGDVLRELAPEAEKAGVILGLEDTISAENNVRIMDRARSKNVLVYYDVGNSTNNGFDVVKEIRWLGKNRICQIHLKDNPHYLGEGSIQFKPILAAIHDIGFSGYANLETQVPKTDLDAGMRRNLAYIRKLMAQVRGAG